MDTTTTVAPTGAAESSASLEIRETFDYTGTYSPEDNKLRLYAVTRLPAEIYARVKAHGFIWAPKQKLFVAPMWTPDRADLLTELCGEIGDEDTSLVERQEERAERFETYSEKRAADAERAQSAVHAIADGIPMGQPILVGHHSERHARKDAERIENGMRKTVKMWETSKYWISRAEGALAHAKYKELPRVRANRIKKIEADKRRQAKYRARAVDNLAFWNQPGLTLEQARAFAGGYGSGLQVCRSDDGTGWSAWDVLKPAEEQYARCPKGWTLEQVQDVARRVYPRSIANCDRWIAHFDNRLAYEKTMLAEQGASELIAKKPRPKQLPLCNYRAPAGLDAPNQYNRGEMIHYPQIEMTQAEYAKIYTDYKGTRVIGNSHRIRTAYVNKPGAPREMMGRSLYCVFLTDSKVHTPPAPVEPAPRTPRVPPVRTESPAKPDGLSDQLRAGLAVAKALKEQLRTGIKVVSAPQLFPTPADLARRMVDEAGIKPGDRVLEPSAGTGRILDALADSGAHVVAVEHSIALADDLKRRYSSVEVTCGDFLECDPQTFGLVDAFVANPPFKDGADVEHVTHMLRFLKPGGRGVSVMSAGVMFRSDRKTTEFRRMIEERGGTFEELPPGTFEESGTGVLTVLLVV